MNAMNFPRVFSKTSFGTAAVGRYGCAAVLLIAALAGGASLAWSHEADELVSEQVTVRQLMRLDTAQALQRLRSAGARAATRAAHGATSGDTSLGHGQSKPQLVAIYGVGPKLMAEVQIDRDTLLFMRGRTTALGPGKSHPMRLVGITPQCVQVQWGEREESLCAPPAINARG